MILMNADGCEGPDGQLLFLIFYVIMFWKTLQILQHLGRVKDWITVTDGWPFSWTCQFWNKQGGWFSRTAEFDIESQLLQTCLDWKLDAIFFNLVRALLHLCWRTKTEYQSGTGMENWSHRQLKALGYPCGLNSDVLQNSGQSAFNFFGVKKTTL